MNIKWRDQANCRGVDPELFMPLRQGMVPVDAMRICSSCDVRTDCLRMALTVNSPEADLGVWGGTTSRARERIRLGTWTVTDAMAHGDQIARRRTAAERRAA